MDVLLDGRLMVSREVLHDLLAEKLELPEYYGRNLDGLYDLLTEPSFNGTVTVSCVSAIKESLGTYAAAFLRTLADAAEKNPGLTVKFFDNFPDYEK